MLCMWIWELLVFMWSMMFLKFLMVWRWFCVWIVVLICWFFIVGMLFNWLVDIFVFCIWMVFWMLVGVRL